MTTRSKVAGATTRYKGHFRWKYVRNDTFHYDTLAEAKADLAALKKEGWTGYIVETASGRAVA